MSPSLKVTDRLAGVSQWPSVTTAFDVPSDAAKLGITVEFRAARYVPGFGQSYRSSHDSARAHLARYTTVSAQLREPGLGQFEVTSSIGQVDSSITTRQEIQLALLGLLEQILAFLGAAGDLTPVCPPIAAGTPLATVARDYAVTAGGIVVANQDVELAGRLVAGGATLAIPTYYVFSTGTAVYLSGQDASYRVQSGDTFATVAAAYGISLDALAARNTGLQLLAVNQGGDDRWLAIPDLVEFPAGQQPCSSVYLVRGGSETIADVIARFPGWDAAGFLALDAELPGLFAPAQLPGTSVTPTLTDTVTSLAAALSVTPQAFVDTFQAQPGVLRAGAAVIALAAGTGQGTTITTAAEPYQGVTPAALAEANAAVRGVLAQQQLTCTGRPDRGDPVTHTYDTQANDTFLTVTSAFNALFGRTTLTVADVVAQNPQAALAGQQPLLVPPAPAALPPLATTLLARYPDPIFPLTVDLRMLGDPTETGAGPGLGSGTEPFADVTPVLPSPLADQPAASLDGFAERFEKAFAGLKLGTGGAAGSAPATTATSSLWVVNFDTARDGIGYRIGAPKPGGFFAVRPLSAEPWTQPDVLVPTYTPGRSLDWTAHHSFSGADLDAWLAMLLASIDRLLSPRFALPAARLGAAAQALLADVRTSKSVIADGLAGLVEHLLGTSPGDRDQAAQALRQQVLTTLSSLYDTTLLVQFPVTVTSPYTVAGTAPALSGTPIVKPYDGTGARGPGSATRVTHTLAAGDTITSVAARLGVTVVDLVTANGEVADVLTPATTVAVLIGGTLTSVPVAAGDTLRAVAGQVFGTRDPAPGQLAEFAAALWSCDVTGGAGGAHYRLCTDPPAPVQPAVLSSIQLLPVVSFGAGKVPLARGSSSLTVLIGIRDPRQRRMAYLDLGFPVTQLEYDVRRPEPVGAAPAARTDRESSWLTFVRPIDASLGQVQIPIPLRACPGAPVLSAQSAAPSHPGDPDLAKAKEWDYAFRLGYQAAAQDSIEAGMFFNRLTDTPPVPTSGDGIGPAGPPAVHVALAQFAQVAAGVEDDLRLLLTDPADPRVRPALQAFHQLVHRVSDAWSGRPLAAAATPGEEGEPHWYRVDPLVDGQRTDEFSYLALTAAGSDPLRPTIDGAPPELLAGTRALYAYRQPISAPLDLELTLPGLDAVGYQNGWSGVSISRNENLLGSTDPADATNPLFVYRTPLSLFSSEVTPALLLDAPAPLTTRSGVDLATALGDFFGAVFGQAPATFRVKVAARYAYSLTSAVRPGSAITPTVPLVLLPLYAFDTAADADQASPASFVSRLAAAVTAAGETIGAVTAPGEYLFDVGVYSSLKPAEAQETPLSMPLLDIRNRSYPGTGQ